MKTSHKTLVEFCMHACKMVELHTIVALFEYTTLMFDLTGWRIIYRNKRINKTIRQNIFHTCVIKAIKPEGLVDHHS